jgi:hypothetical protein
MPRRKPFRMIQQVLQARARGATNAEAAELVGVASMTVIRWGQQYGPMSTRMSKPRADALTGDEREEIRVGSTEKSPTPRSRGVSGGTARRSGARSEPTAAVTPIGRSRPMNEPPGLPAGGVPPGLRPGRGCGRRWLSR